MIMNGRRELTNKLMYENTLENGVLYPNVTHVLQPTT